MSQAPLFVPSAPEAKSSQVVLLHLVVESEGPHEPRGWGVEVVRIGRFHRPGLNSDAKRYQRRLVHAAKWKWSGPAYRRPVALRVVVYRHRPLRLCKSSGPLGRLWAPVKPDLTNVQKLVEDALVKAGVIADDNQTVHIESKSLYPEAGAPSRVEVTLLSAPESPA